MKQIEVEITTDFGFAHYGGAMTDETSSNIEISDRLADYLRPLLEDGLNMEVVRELQQELEQSDPALAKELDKLYEDIEDLCRDQILEYSLENDRDYYDDDNLNKYYQQDIKDSLFAPSKSIEAFYEEHKDDYEDFDEDYDCIKDDYDCAIWNEYMDWIDHLEDNYERAERCFGDFSPMERCLDWDYEIWSISK